MAVERINSTLWPPSPTERQAQLLSQHLEVVTLFTGKKGRGKSISMVCMAWYLREIFNLKVVLVSTKMGLTKRFGPYQYINERDFFAQLDKISEISEDMDDATLGAAVDEVLAKMGVSIYGALLLFDESYKLFDARTPSDKSVRVFGYFVAQSRHYHCTIVMSAPREDMIDKRVRQQVDWIGACRYYKAKRVAAVHFERGFEVWNMFVQAEYYFGLYDTHNLLGYRKKHLDIKGVYNKTAIDKAKAEAEQEEA